MRPDKTLIEERFKETIDAWVADGRPTGHFIAAVLSNDLREAIGRADEQALDNLPHIVAYIFNDCPSSCWGSPQKVRDYAKWIAKPENQAEIARVQKARGF